MPALWTQRRCLGKTRVRKKTRWDATGGSHAADALKTAVDGSAATRPGAAATLMDQAAAMGLLPAQLAGSKKQREIYVGNLCAGALTAQGLRELFGSLVRGRRGKSELGASRDHPAAWTRRRRGAVSTPPRAEGTKRSVRILDRYPWILD